MNSKIYGFSTELRAAGDENEMKLEGRAIVFNQPTILYSYDNIDYKEIIDSKALDKTDMSDVVMRYNHAGTFIILARTRNRSLTLEKRQDGLYIKAVLQPDMQGHKEIYAAVRSGLVDKMSFGFVVAENGDNYDSTTHTRTITNIRNLFDVSVCDQAAYDSTSVEARSRLKQFTFEEYRQALLIRANLLKRRFYHEKV